MRKVSFDKTEFTPTKQTKTDFTQKISTFYRPRPFDNLIILFLKRTFAFIFYHNAM